jgi:glycosyltransferase involved in cell wall biosynthesis
VRETVDGTAAAPGIVEVRVPTFRRPDLLREALSSLAAQTWTAWHAVVLDDCPDRSARATAEEVLGDRATYLPNGRRLGAAGNIDRAFRREPYREGSAHFCVLEDDNLLEPEFLREALAALARHRVEVALVNQSVRVLRGGAWVADGRTTRGGVFAGEVLRPGDLRAGGLVSEGISNGGLLWSRDCRSDLEVGPAVDDAVLQERLRTWTLEEPVAFLDRPLGVWREVEHAVRRGGPGWRRRWRWARLARGVQGLARRAADLHPESVEALYARLRAAGDPRAAAMVENLARARRSHPGQDRVPEARLGRLRRKGALLEWAVPDPSAPFWRARGEPGGGSPAGPRRD